MLICGGAVAAGAFRAVCWDGSGWADDLDLSGSGGHGGSVGGDCEIRAVVGSA